MTRKNKKDELSPQFLENMRIIECETKARLARFGELSPEDRKGIAAFAELIHQARASQLWSRQELATRTEIPYWWLTLAENGCLLPEDITEGKFLALGRAFPPDVAKSDLAAFLLATLKETFETFPSWAQPEDPDAPPNMLIPYEAAQSIHSQTN